MAHHKTKLPSKVCVVCHKPFMWRKKWQRDWDNVKYCSKKCQSNKTSKDLNASIV